MEEKLQHFYEVSVENAKEEAEQAVREYEQVLEASLEEHRQAKRRQMEMELQAETENAKRQMNKALSAEQLRIKRRLSRTQDQLKEKLFVRVAEKLEEFRKTPEYVTYLESRIQIAREFAGRYPLSLSVGAGDAALAERLSQAAGRTVAVEPEDFGGGLRAVIPFKNVLMDGSFDSLIQGARDAFAFDGRMLHG